tara:strand:+ start:2240 stop:2482 length:243 start_codon:yes stop_codon:yes gene_type:complete
MAKGEAPLICGGIYEWINNGGKTFQGVVVGVTYNGTRVEGLLMSSGFAPETVAPGTERWGQLKLIGRPASPSVGRPKKKS